MKQRSVVDEHRWLIIRRTADVQYPDAEWIAGPFVTRAEARLWRKEKLSSLFPTIIAKVRFVIESYD